MEPGAGTQGDGQGIIVDSALAFSAAVAGTRAPAEVLETLTVVPVRYFAFDGLRHAGQLVIHRDLAQEIGEIFALLEERRFPVSRAVPVCCYGWSDEASMAADNSSAFNYRCVAGTDRLSLHGQGRAVDINPFRNPVLYPDGRVSPDGAVYRPGAPGVFGDGDGVVQLFLRRGWRWGGHFPHCRDLHHFEKAG